MAQENTTVLVPPGTTISASGNSGSSVTPIAYTAGVLTTGCGVLDFGYGTPDTGCNIGIEISGVVGNPNTLFKVETSDDLVNWFDAGFDDQGPIETIGARNIHFGSKRRYARLAWLLDVGDPGEAGAYSSASSYYQEVISSGVVTSSLVNQSFNASSGSGAAPISLTFMAYLALTAAS